MSSDIVTQVGDGSRHEPEERKSLRDDLDDKLTEALASEDPPAGLCVDIARLYRRLGDVPSSYLWLQKAVTNSMDYVAWTQAHREYAQLVSLERPPARRKAKIAIASSYTSAQLGPMIELACLRWGIDAEIYEAPYGQYRQAALDPSHAVHDFEADFTIVAVHEGDVQLPLWTEEPADAVTEEVERWRRLWSGFQRSGRGTVIQCNFAVRPDSPFGHLAVRLPGTRPSMIQAVNAALGVAAARDQVLIVDCDRLASLYGKERWFDPRYWHLSKQAVALGATPLLARHIAAVIAADLGLSKRCAVLDLDGTLWGGTIGEDGLGGIRLGGGPEGEAFIAFQVYLLALRQRGIVLAVCSKNNEDDALEPFSSHPDMRISLDDIAVFVANWESKASNLQDIADRLGLGLESLVFIDDNPAERQQVRDLLPEVEVITLPPDPALYVATLDRSLLFEPGSLTAEDAHRTEQYRARAQASDLRSTSATLEDFYRDLHMKASVKPFDELDLSRIAQLVAKTNQFNVTTRRHSRADLRAFMESPPSDVVHLSVRLEDRFSDHGVVAVLIGTRSGDDLTIETWLMSCRVIGRTLEHHMFRHLVRRARELGCATITGTYIPTARNQPVAELFPTLGFEPVGEDGGTTTWCYQTDKPVPDSFIEDVKEELGGLLA